MATHPLSTMFPITLCCCTKNRLADKVLKYKDVRDMCYKQEAKEVIEGIKDNLKDKILYSVNHEPADDTHHEENTEDAQKYAKYDDQIWIQ